MSLKKELPRFLVAGFSAVGTDYVSYMLMLNWLNEPVSKGVSFIFGSVVAFLINKYWTFESAPHSLKEIASFILLYLSTLIANVTVNQLVLLYFPVMILMAFLMATATSTVLNFMGMKYWVFKQGDRQSEIVL